MNSYQKAPLTRSWERAVALQFYSGQSRDGISSMGHAVLIPATAISNGISALSGVIGLVGMTVTGGTNQDINRFATSNANGFRLLAGSVEHFIKMVNPNTSPIEEGMDEDSFSSPEDIEGILAPLVQRFFEDRLWDATNPENNALHRHVEARAICVPAMLGMVIARVVDAAIGVFATVGVLMTLGKCKKINEFALKGLMAPMLVRDLFWFATKMINPNAFNEEEWSEKELSLAPPSF